MSVALEYSLLITACFPSSLQAFKPYTLHTTHPYKKKPFIFAEKAAVITKKMLLCILFLIFPILWGLDLRREVFDGEDEDIIKTFVGDFPRVFIGAPATAWPAFILWKDSEYLKRNCNRMLQIKQSRNPR